MLIETKSIQGRKTTGKAAWLSTESPLTRLPASLHCLKMLMALLLQAVARRELNSNLIMELTVSPKDSVLLV